MYENLGGGIMKKIDLNNIVLLFIEIVKLIRALLC